MPRLQRSADVDGRTVAAFSIRGGKHVGAIGPSEGRTIAELCRLAAQSGVPDRRDHRLVRRRRRRGDRVPPRVGTRSLARMADASGVVPTVLTVVGPCVSGPALLLGIADVVVMTDEAFAYVSGPDTVRAFTGIDVDHRTLGGAAMHGTRSGVASFVVRRRDHGP